MAPKQKAKLTPYHHGDLRRTLLRTALELLESAGDEALTLRGVAARAGVSHAAPYRHFAARDALLAAVNEEAFAALHLSGGMVTWPLDVIRIPTTDSGAAKERLHVDYDHVTVNLGPRCRCRASVVGSRPGAFAAPRATTVWCYAAAVTLQRKYL